jgi:MoaA/NifB/PqqE/SkfB family radical SAM enzyme
MDKIKPFRIRLGASSVCQLACPSCATAKGLVADAIGARFLKFEDFKALVDHNDWISAIELSSRGEIFLNPDLLPIMAYACQRGVHLTAGTGSNLNTVSEDVLEGLVRYKFRYLSCSIDGASQETYGIYRIGGNFDKVMANIRKINELKEHYHTQWPELSWQFIVFGHNEHEIPLARRMAKELGMQFRPKLAYCKFSPVKDREFVRKETGLGVASEAEYREKTGSKYLQKGICSQLWEAPQVHSDGRVLGCCVNYTWGDYGNAFQDGLLAVLNNEKMVYARQMLLGKLPPRDGVPCAQCPSYKFMRDTDNWMSPENISLKNGAPGKKRIFFLPIILRKAWRRASWVLEDIFRRYFHRRGHVLHG